METCELDVKITPKSELFPDIDIGGCLTKVAYYSAIVLFVQII